MTFPTTYAATVFAASLIAATSATAQEAVNCNQFNNIVSYAPGAGQSMTMYNSSDSRRTLMWMDQTGTPVYLTDIEVGGNAEYAVAPGDIFAVTDGPGNCVEMFRVTQGQTVHTFTAIATGQGGD